MSGKGVVTAAALVALSVCSLSACSQPAETTSERFRVHATAVAKAWSTPDQQERWAASVIPLGSLTVEPDWSGHEALQAGVRAGALDWVTEKVGDAAASGTVEYADGSTEDVTTLGARATLSELFDGGTSSCPTSCRAAVVNSADLTTVQLLTARGPATVPAWAFHLDGLAQPVLRVAVAGLATLDEIEPQVADADSAAGLVPASLLVREQGNAVTVRMAKSSCAGAVTPRVLETDVVVVVGATRPPPRQGDGCADVLRDEDVTVTLARPLGQRILVTTDGHLVHPASPAAS